MHVLESNDYNDELKQNSDVSYANLDDCINDQESMSIREFKRPQKRQRMLDPTPIVFGLIRTKKGTDRNTKTIKILLDSGGSSTIVKHDIVKELRVVENKETLWTTTAGNFSTTGPVRSPSSYPNSTNMHVFILMCM